MKRSTERILTTHTGSLQRPSELISMIGARDRGEPYDKGALALCLRSAVGEIVREQVEAGLDIINDGEHSKNGFYQYATERLSGFEWRPGPRTVTRTDPWRHGAGLERVKEARPPRPDLQDSPGHFRGDLAEFPEAALLFGQDDVALGAGGGYACVGPITLKNPSAVGADIENLKAAIAERDPVEVFMPSASPGTLLRLWRQGYYQTEEEFMYAAADAMREEYQAIVGAGFLLQLDSPDLASSANTDYSSLSIPEFRKIIEKHVEALNHAIKGLPPEQVRVHVAGATMRAPTTATLPSRTSSTSC